jgi:hypothetical protein
MLAEWRPAPGGGKRSDEARPSLRACVPLASPEPDDGPARRLRCAPGRGLAASLFYRTAKAGAFFRHDGGS